MICFINITKLNFAIFIKYCKFEERKKKMVYYFKIPPKHLFVMFIRYISILSSYLFINTFQSFIKTKKEFICYKIHHKLTLYFEIFNLTMNLVNISNSNDTTPHIHLFT